MKPLTIQEAKDIQAVLYGYPSWHSLITTASYEIKEKAIDEVVNAYSLSCQEAFREELAKDADELGGNITAYAIRLTTFIEG